MRRDEGRNLKAENLHTYRDIFSPVNASLSGKSIFWEKLFPCAASTGSNKGTEIYMCFLFDLLYDLFLPVIWLLFFLQSPLSFTLSIKDSLTYNLYHDQGILKFASIVVRLRVRQVCNSTLYKMICLINGKNLKFKLHITLLWVES